MFLEIERFQDEIHEEFICSICSGVLNEPEVTKCDHTFCSTCIRGWLEQKSTCPIDRKRIQKVNPASRSIKNVILSFKLTCDNAEYGCTEVVQLGKLATHLKTCKFDPKAEVACEHGCGMKTSVESSKEHNCIREMRLMISDFEEKLKRSETKLTDNKRKLTQVQLEYQQQNQDIVKIAMELKKQKQKFRHLRKSLQSTKKH